MAATKHEVEPVNGVGYSLVFLHDKTPAIALARLPLVIGRGPDADVRLDDQHVSRRHCEVLLAENALVVRDLGSTNGTFVNGIRTELSPLGPDDVLTLGGMKFVVQTRSMIATSP